MPRGIKQKTGLDTDFSINDAVKRANVRKAQLREAAGYEAPNETDMLNEELENANESPEVRKIFED
jgi:hypothetical protein